MIRPTPVHRPVWEPVYRDVQGPVWLNGAGGEPYPGHNMVVFANQDLLVGSALGLTTPAGFLMAAKFRLPSLPAAEWYLWNSGKGVSGAAAYTYLGISSTGELLVGAGNASAGAPAVFGATVGAGLVADTDYTVHVSIDSTARVYQIENIVSTAAQTTFTYVIDYIPGVSVVTAADVVQTVDVDFTVTQASPAILEFAVGAGVSDTYILENPTERMKVWVNGAAQTVSALVDSAGTPFTMTSATANRSVIGSRHAAVATPNYDADGYLGWVDGGAGDVGVQVGFFIFDDAANTDPTTTSNNGSDIDLSAFKAAGATPALVFFGGEQEAADWNAGTNQGTATGWTMTNDVT